MALVVDNVPMSPTCNSYASLAEMLAYVTERVPDPAVLAAWTSLTEAQKSMYLVNATRSIDSFADWVGDRYYSQQRLDWPRYNTWIDGRYWLETAIFPSQVIEATCEMAIWMMQQNGVVAQAQNLAYDSIKLGPITIDFNETAGGTLNKYFPDVIAIILKDLAVLNNPDLPSANRLKVATLHRA
jgi:hypothetical protein